MLVYCMEKKSLSKPEGESSALSEIYHPDRVSVCILISTIPVTMSLFLYIGNIVYKIIYNILIYNKYIFVYYINIII